MSIQRGRNGQFVPGVSPNPGGRPAIALHIKEALKDLSEGAVAVLAECLNSPDERIRLMAAKEVLDRSLGKPTTMAAIEVNSQSIHHPHLAALIALSQKSLIGHSTSS